MLKDLKNNNRGIIFVTVLIIIIVAMVLSISILSLNVSQITSSEDELKRIQARMIADGALSQMIVQKMTGNPSNFLTYNETIGGTTFVITANIDSTSTGPGGVVNPLTIDVTY